MKARNSGKFRRFLALMLALLMVFALVGCDGDKDPSDKDSGGNGNSGATSGGQAPGGNDSGEDPPDDSFGGFGVDDYGTGSGGEAVAVPGQYKTVFHHTNEAEDLWCYLVWDEDGRNVRMVFFGEGNTGEVAFTTMDEENYYGNPVDAVNIGGKIYDGAAEFAMQSSYEGYAGLRIKTAGGEEEYIALDGVVSIEPVPARYRGYFFGTYLDPLMILDGDGYKLTAQLSDAEHEFTVDNLFYCCSVWDDEKEYSIRCLDSMTYSPDGSDDFNIYESEWDQKTININWLRYDKSGNRVDGTQQFSTYYYHFYDRKAPEDFENHDKEGKWGRIPACPAGADFASLSEDYIITRTTERESIYDSGAGEYRDYDVDTYELFSFDETGKCLQNIEMMIFPDATGAELYKAYWGYYYDITADGNICYISKLKNERDYCKDRRLASIFGGLSTYSDHTWYEGVHYYEQPDPWDDSLKQIYISVIPHAMSIEEHKAIIDRRGLYMISENQYLQIGFDDDLYYVSICDYEAFEVPGLYGKMKDVKFTDAGFDARCEEANYWVTAKGEYVSEGVKVTISIVPKDHSEMDDTYVKPSAQTVEKVYPFRSKEFR